MTPATGICRTCQRPAGEVPFNGMTLYGHIDPPHPSHRVRFVRLSRSGQPSASVPARGNAASTEVSERSYEDAPDTSLDPAPGRVGVPAQSGRAVPRVSMPDHLPLREQAVSTPASPGARLHGLLGPGKAQHRRG